MTKKTDQHRLQIDLHQVADTLPTDGSRQQWVQVLPESNFSGRDGRGPYTYDPQAVIDAFAANKADLPIFCDHIWSGKAYGWVKALRYTPGVGIEALIEWTQEGFDLVASKAYRYLSPTFFFLSRELTHATSDTVTELMEVSLVNLPNLYMKAVSNSRYTAETASTTEDEMTPEILAALGLAEGATAEEVLTAITALQTSANAAQTTVAAIAEAVGTEATADASALVTAAQSRFATDLSTYVARADYDVACNARDAATNELAEIKAAQHTAEINAAVDAAIAGGKVTPAGRDAAVALATKDLASFSAFIATAPTVIAQAVATHSTEDTTHGLTAEQLSMCKQYGIEPAIFAKNVRKS